MSSPIKVPDQLAGLIAAELQPGEEIVWLGQPIPRLFARRGIGLVVFGLPLAAFASTIFFKDELSSAAMFVVLNGIFVVVGLIMTCSPFWLARRARRTAYVITNRRAIVFDAGFGQSTTVRSYEPARLTDMRRKERRDGTGDLILDRAWWKDNDSEMQFTDHGFLAIRDVKRVEDLVRRLQESTI